MGQLDRGRQVEFDEIIGVLEAAAESVTPDDPVTMYLREIAAVAPLSPDKELELVAGVRRGDQVARYRLMEVGLWEVVRMARLYVGRGLSFLDLVQEGNLGLTRAVFEIPLGDGSYGEQRDARIREAIERAVD